MLRLRSRDRRVFLDSETLNSILRGTDAETSYARIPNQQLFDGSQNYIRLITDEDDNHGLLQSILSKIQRGGDPLISVADIVQGIVTGANQVTERQIQKYGFVASPGEGIFILSSREAQSLRLNERESKFIKPWYKKVQEFRHR